MDATAREKVCFLFHHRSAHHALIALALGLLASASLFGSSRSADLSVEQALQGPNRTPAFVQRDAARHPAEELWFFKVTRGAKVVEIWPGGGYWAEILAPFLHDQGHYTLAVDVPDGEPEGQNFALGPKLAGRLNADPADYGRIRYAFFGAKQSDLAPDSADVVLTFRNLHNWVNQGDVEQLLTSILRTLKLNGSWP